MDKLYWENYYKNQAVPQSPSLFAEFVLGFLDSALVCKTECKILELGCGNGRDAKFFAKNFSVIAIDQALQENQNQKNLVFLKADFTRFWELNLGAFDLIYSRFSLHAIRKKEADLLFLHLLQNLNENGILAIEARGKKNSLYKKGEAFGRDSFYFNSHYRRFIDILELRNEILDLKYLDFCFEILFCKEARGFAPINNEDDFFIRLIARKIRA